MSNKRGVVSRLDAEARSLGPPRLLQDLPQYLAAVAAHVLNVEAASLSVLSLEVRVPLGASDDHAMAAELLQFTLGEGPCLDALSRRQVINYPLEHLQASWPRFTHDLLASTPFRSVTSAPLPFTEDGGGGALDLYLHSETGSTQLNLAEVSRTAGWIVDQLCASLSPLSLAGPDVADDVPWLRTVGARDRMEVWVAMGILSSRLELGSSDALHLMRDWAQSHGTDVNDVAANLSAGRLNADQLRP